MIGSSAQPQNPHQRIHIVGIGNVGCFIAHSLRSISEPPPVTLIFHNQEQEHHWNSGNKEIGVCADGSSSYQGGYDTETMPRKSMFNADIEVNHRSTSSAPHLRRKPSNEHRKIDNLIVCVNANFARAALFRLRHRLHKHSSILILSSGMGIVEDLNELVFPDEAIRPNYLIGVFTHGIITKSLFSVVHARLGSIYISQAERQSLQKKPVYRSSVVRSKYLLRQLTRVSTLRATGLVPHEFFLIQLEGLVVDAVINPLSATLDVHPGALLHNISISHVIRLLITEISLVIRSLPELQSLTNVNERFSVGRLEKIVTAKIGRIAQSDTNVLKHVQNGQHGEIDFVNGYFVQRGEELGINCVTNLMFMQLVKGRADIIKRTCKHVEF